MGISDKEIAKIIAESDEDPMGYPPEADPSNGQIDWTCCECGHVNPGWFDAGVKPGREKCSKCGHEKCDDCVFTSDLISCFPKVEALEQLAHPTIISPYSSRVNGSGFGTKSRQC